MFISSITLFLSYHINFIDEIVPIISIISTTAVVSKKFAVLTMSIIRLSVVLASLIYGLRLCLYQDKIACITLIIVSTKCMSSSYRSDQFGQLYQPHGVHELCQLPTSTTSMVLYLLPFLLFLLSTACIPAASTRQARWDPKSTLYHFAVVRSP